ncbi:LysR family transcriptional regulator [Mesorhizobium tianshanense]|nr:LysR family transcriptional regulator [Mesorhizobium tianshanense]GLS35106.1 LysR family transcriptional regulator [Mesorhizobium tianshanense]
MMVFAKSVETGSFSKAAEAFSMSPQAIGKHIRGLEQHLDVKLIHRTTRRQSLTDFGQAYYQRVRTILAEIDAAESLAQESRAVPRGRLRINAPVTLGAHELARVLPEYLANHPKVEVELTLADRLVDLVDEGYDAVFRTGPLGDSGLIARQLRPMRFVLCAAPSYMAQRGAPIRPEDLRHHECLGFAYGSTRDRWRFTSPDGEEVIEVKCRTVANNGQALLTLALAGLGVLMQPEALVREALSTGKLVPLLPDYAVPSRPLHILYAPDRRITPKLRSFLDFAVEKFGLEEG